MGIEPSLLWAWIIAFGLMMYVIMDGFDLGIGMLFPFIRSRDERDTMSIRSRRSGTVTRTWLVLGGAGLLAAFPVAYAVILSALYFPIMLMLGASSARSFLRVPFQGG